MHKETSINAKICTLLFLRQDDTILLAMKKRGFGADRYNGVGGKVDSGETIEQALVRECQEEIEVTPLAYTKVAELDFLQVEGNTPWRMYVHVYLCTEWQGTPKETEEMAPRWFTLGDIPYDSMWQDDIFWLPKVLEGKSLFGGFTFDQNDTMLSHDIKEVKAYS